MTVTRSRVVARGAAATDGLWEVNNHLRGGDGPTREEKSAESERWREEQEAE